MKRLKKLLSLSILTLLTACASYNVDSRSTIATSDKDPFLTTESIEPSSNPLVNYNSIHHPVLAKNGMVVSQNHLASEVGLSILKQGGNAIDSAIATAFALAVTLPRAGNIGGGGFMLVHLAEIDEQFAIDYREIAPELATRDMYLDVNGDVDNDKAWYSHQSAGVPGTVAGMHLAWKKWGSLPWSALLKPAVILARQGFQVSYDLSSRLEDNYEFLTKSSVTKHYLYKDDGQIYQPNETLIQSDLANTLERIAESEGRDFYTGKTADLIVADMQANGGLITHKDLAAYQPLIRAVVNGEFAPSNNLSYQIVSMPPPSSGGIHLIQMLNILEHLPVQDTQHNSAQTLHFMVEAMRQAYADRSAHLGDPDFFEVPVDYLVSEAYAESVAKQLDLKRAKRSDQVAPVSIPPYESPDTTHFSVVDQWGNAVSNTYTINFSYGSGIMVKEAGFLLNNEMDDFSSKPGVQNAYGLIGSEANKIEAKKRPLSSMTPTLVFKNRVNAEGRKEKTLYLVTGSPGGSRIITAVLQNILNVTVHDMNIAQATHAPRMHHQWMPDEVYLEPGISIDTATLLKQRGHKVSFDETMGSVQAILVDDDLLQGAADPRRPDAKAVGY